MKSTWLTRFQKTLALPTYTRKSPGELSLSKVSRLERDESSIHKEVPLNSLPAAGKTIRLCKIQWQTAGKALFTTSKGISVRNPLFELRALSSSYIPPRLPDGFGVSTSIRQGYTPFGLVTTIKGISKRATERNRVRTRFKQALRLVLTRDAMPAAPDNMDSIKIATGERDETIRESSNESLLIEGYHYVAFLRPDVYAVPIPTLVGEVRRALVELKHKQTSPKSKPYGNKRDRPNKKIQAKLPPFRKGPVKPPSRPPNDFSSQKPQYSKA